VSIEADQLRPGGKVQHAGRSGQPQAGVNVLQPVEAVQPLGLGFGMLPESPGSDQRDGPPPAPPANSGTAAMISNDAASRQAAWLAGAAGADSEIEMAAITARISRNCMATCKRERQQAAQINSRTARAGAGAPACIVDAGRQSLKNSGRFWLETSAIDPAARSDFASYTAGSVVGRIQLCSHKSRMLTSAWSVASLRFRPERAVSAEVATGAAVVSGAAMTGAATTDAVVTLAGLTVTLLLTAAITAACAEGALETGNLGEAELMAGRTRSIRTASATTMPLAASLRVTCSDRS